MHILRNTKVYGCIAFYGWQLPEQQCWLTYSFSNRFKFYFYYVACIKIYSLYTVLQKRIRMRNRPYSIIPENEIITEFKCPLYYLCWYFILLYENMKYLNNILKMLESIS